MVKIFNKIIFKKIEKIQAGVELGSIWVDILIKNNKPFEELPYDIRGTIKINNFFNE